jgi:hypothetical protein
LTAKVTISDVRKLEVERKYLKTGDGSPESDIDVVVISED